MLCHCKMWICNYIQNMNLQLFTKNEFAIAKDDFVIAPFEFAITKDEFATAKKMQLQKMNL